MKFNWKHFAIALALFLLGYFTFNNKLFGNAGAAKVSSADSHTAIFSAHRAG